jgi:hypothetical protein
MTLNRPPWGVWMLLPSNGNITGWSLVLRDLAELDAQIIATKATFPARAMPEGEPPVAREAQDQKANRRTPHPRR